LTAYVSPEVLRGRWRVHSLASLNYLCADAVDFKGLLTLDDVDELVTFLTQVERKPEAGRPDA
jgi:hypothetical protein